MKTVTVAQARQTLSSLISEVEQFDERIMITKNGQPTAVIVSADEWEAIEETGFWRSVPQVLDDLQVSRGETGMSIDAYLVSVEPEIRDIRG